ncbi:MAG: hypothetical protein NTY93_01860 [Candidatus Kaiserbacteria bacterium]|nr:hypothetical protein [Candidatus Kaiserbacteria bacterium]
MIYTIKLTPRSHPKLEEVYTKAMDELDSFFEISWTRNRPNIILVPDRKTISALRKQETEEWLVGWAGSNGDVYLLNDRNFEKESNHTYSDTEYFALLKHELAHCFTNIVSRNKKPTWLLEGIAIYLSGQTNHKPKLEKFEKFLYFFDNGGKEVYTEAGFAVMFLIKKYGKRKLLTLLKSSEDIKSKEDFAHLFESLYGFALSYENFDVSYERPVDQNQTVKLTILYSVEQEIERVRDTIMKFSWFAEQGYTIERLKLPGGITKDSSDEDIIRAVNEEYSETDYAECATKLQEEWRFVSEEFEKMRNEPAFHLKDEYTVVLTKYGMGGSYDADSSKVIVNITSQLQGGVEGTVAHEIIHMTVQYLIDQYHVRHWRKERWVDLLMERYFPELEKMQNIKEDVSMVDQAFEKFFPDMEAIAKSIGN